MMLYNHEYFIQFIENLLHNLCLSFRIHYDRLVQDLSSSSDVPFMLKVTERQIFDESYKSLPTCQKYLPENYDYL